MSIIYLLINYLVCLNCMFWREIIVLAEWCFKLDFWGIISGNVYGRKQAKLYTFNRAGIGVGGKAAFGLLGGATACVKSG